MKLKPGMKCFRRDGLPFGHPNDNTRYGVIKSIKDNKVNYHPDRWDYLFNWHEIYIVKTKLSKLFYL